MNIASIVTNPFGWLFTVAILPLWRRYIRPWLHVYARLVGYASFIAALIFAVLWFLQARKMSETANTLLTHPREAVPDRFPALNSLILSKIDFPNTGDQERFPSTEVVEIANTVRSALMKMPEQHSLNPKLLKISSSAAASSVTDRYVYDNNGDAALFLPAFILPVRRHITDQFTIADVTAALHQSPQIVYDIEASAAIASLLPHFDGKQMFATGQERVVAAYLIATTGVTRMWQNNYKGDEIRNNFNPHRFFPDRPYFWPALQPHSSASTRFSYVSQPYFDVAGNGIVVTACWGITGLRGNDSVLCLDSRRKAPPLDVLLKDYLASPVDTFKCASQNESKPHQCALSENSEVHSKIRLKIRELDEDHRFDEMQGGLFVIDEHQTSDWLEWWQLHPLTGSVKLATSLLKYLMLSDERTKVFFTAPAPEETTSAKEIAFHVFAIDVAKPHRLLLYFAVATFAFGMLAGICFYVLHRQQLYAVRFIDEVVNVMKISPIAFCYLDEEDRIERHNEAMCELTGYSSAELQVTTLASLLDHESANRYRKVSDRRELMLDTPPYEVKLATKKNGFVNVVISGSPLYFNVNRRSRMPQTFGILLRVNR